MSRVVTVPGAILSFCFMLYFLWPEIQAIYNARRHRMIPLFGMTISVVSFTMFAAWYFWPGGKDSQQANEVAAFGVDHNQNHPEETPLPSNAKGRLADRILKTKYQILEPLFAKYMIA
jgi:hypothetical protein